MKEHIEHCFDGLKDMFSGTESYDSRYLVGALYADSSIPFNALNGSEGFLDGAAQWLGKAWDYIKYQSEFILTEFIPNFLSVLDYSFEYLGSSNWTVLREITFMDKPVTDDFIKQKKRLQEAFDDYHKDMEKLIAKAKPHVSSNISKVLDGLTTKVNLDTKTATYRDAANWVRRSHNDIATLFTNARKLKDVRSEIKSKISALERLIKQGKDTPELKKEIDDCKETLAAISKATRKVWDLVEVTTASFKSVRRIMGKWAGWVY